MIHYHGLPLTPTTVMLRVFSKRHCMVSFENPEQIEVAAEVCQSIALDNGAFTAWTQDRSVDVGAYVAWVTDWIKHPAVDWALIPDVIDGGEQENDALLREWPLPSALSVPVYHMHESLDRLNKLVLLYPRVAIGSSGRWPTPGTSPWWSRMAEIMTVACDADGRPRCKLHGLRMLDPVIFSHLPLSSADSTNVARNVGIDSRWSGAYAPKSKETRAAIIIERIESHASSNRWVAENAGRFANYELIG